MKISAIAALESNYYWLLEPEVGQGWGYLVDVGDAEPVLRTLEHRQVALRGVIVTHHHWDHTDGLEQLLRHHPVPVYGPHSERIPQITHPLAGGDRLQLPGIDFEVLAIPGHTLDHLAYLHRPAHGVPLLFCGDTLFAAGCGRLFEGTPAQMLTSLNTLAALPDDTLIYCGHEYTLANLAFAAAVEPDNPAIAARRRDAQRLRDQGLPTLPSTLAQEKASNPFLRCHLTSVAASAARHLGQCDPLDSAVEVFAAIRRWKDSF